MPVLSDVQYAVPALFTFLYDVLILLDLLYDVRGVLDILYCVFELVLLDMPCYVYGISTHHTCYMYCRMYTLIDALYCLHVLVDVLYDVLIPS